MADTPIARAWRRQLFRLNRFDESIERYETLLAEHKEARSTDVLTNMAAAYVMAGRAAQLPAALKALHAAPSDAFELAYNSACGLVQLGDLPAAEEMLLLAQRARPALPPAPLTSSSPNLCVHCSAVRATRGVSVAPPRDCLVVRGVVAARAQGWARRCSSRRRWTRKRWQRSCCR